MQLRTKTGSTILSKKDFSGCSSGSKRVGTIARHSGLVKMWKFENLPAAARRYRSSSNTPLIRRRTVSTYRLAQAKASVAPTISSAATPGRGDVVVRLEQAGEPLGVVLLRQ